MKRFLSILFLNILLVSALCPVRSFCAEADSAAAEAATAQANGTAEEAADDAQANDTADTAADDAQTNSDTAVAGATAPEQPTPHIEDGVEYPSDSWPKGPELAAGSAYLLETSSNLGLYSLNGHERMYPASTTKLLTCLLAMDYVTDLKDTVKFSEKAVLSVPEDGSTIGIDPGQTLTVEETLLGILVGSANECSNAIAEYCCGSIEAFVEQMNIKAAEIGCTESHFANTNGYHDDEHYTSAHDLAMIGKAFFENDYLRGIGNTPNYHFVAKAGQPDDFWLRNKHQLINGDLPFEGVLGGKTGYTSLAGQTLVTGAERDGMRLIAVVMKEVSPLQFTETELLLKYGFENFSLISPRETGTHYMLETPEFLRSGFDLLGHSAGSFVTDDQARILLPRTFNARDLQPTLSLIGSDGIFGRITYSCKGLTLGEAALTYIPVDIPVKQETAKFVDVRYIILPLCIVMIVVFLLGALREFTKSYAFTRRRDIWKSRLDSRKRHKRYDFTNFRD